jgi:cytochrome c oxidase cbb3-type subunit 3
MNLSKNWKDQGAWIGRTVSFIWIFLCPIFVFGQDKGEALSPVLEAETRYSGALAYTLLGVTFLLMLVIFFLGKVVALSATTKMEKDRNTSGIAKAVLLLSVFYSQALTATTVAAPVIEPVSTVSAYLVYLLLTVILLEFIIILYFTSMIYSFLKPAQAEVSHADKVAKKWFSSWFMKKNSDEEIASLDLGHNYDGIKELDNDIPSWWKYGFYVSIVIAVVYLYVYHIGNVAPLQQEELRIAMANAEQHKAMLLKDAKNNVDENTVTMLAGSDLEMGRQLFIKPGACATCHGTDGGGMVNGSPGIGPNLTDKYWLHKGSLKDIFYSIKYGWPEKGMKSWKEDYSPLQIAQLSSYVKSLQGTKPATAKDKQGEVWDEVPAAPADSSGLK